MKVQIFSELTIDGKISLKSNESSKTFLERFNEDEMRFIHNYRGKVDGILIGRNTVTIDNPSLTNRFGNGKRPNRIVISNSLSFTFKENIFSNDAHTIIVTSESNRGNEAVQRIEEMGHECLFIGENQVDYTQLMTCLESEKGYESLMVEGGSIVIGNVLRHNLADEIHILRLPIVAISADAPCFSAGSELENGMTELKLKNVTPYGSFVLESYEVLK